MQRWPQRVMENSLKRLLFVVVIAFFFRLFTWLCTCFEPTRAKWKEGKKSARLREAEVWPQNIQFQIGSCRQQQQQQLTPEFGPPKKAIINKKPSQRLEKKQNQSQWRSSGSSRRQINPFGPEVPAKLEAKAKPQRSRKAGIMHPSVLASFSGLTSTSSPAPLPVQLSGMIELGLLPLHRKQNLEN